MANPNLQFKTVTKRDGKEAAFDRSKIENAIRKAILAYERRPSSGKEAKTERSANLIARDAMTELCARAKREGVSSPHVEIIQDAVLETLHREISRGINSRIPDPERVWMGYMIFREGRRYVREGKISDHEFNNQAKMLAIVEDIRQWNQMASCDTVDGLNEWFERKDTRFLIDRAEEKKTRELKQVASHLEIAMAQHHVRAIIITGPSSSGKTTTTKRATRSLADICFGFDPDLGSTYEFKPIEVDMYYKPLDAHERIEYKVDGKTIPDTNYELPHSYDTELFNEHLELLLRGETIHVPHYDFVTGKRTKGAPFSLGRDEILLIDCMHALSPEMTEAIPKEGKVKIYIEAMNMLSDRSGDFLRWTDLRLMRRMLRDVRTRGHSVESTVRHWHLVRKGERFIFPYVFSADLIINGGLPYELPILKHYLQGVLEGIAPVFDRNPDLYDGRMRIERIRKLFSQLATATPEQIAHVPKDSILREFIGGSEFFER